MNSLLKRTISGALYAAILLGCTLSCKYAFGVMLLAFTSLMIHEFLKMNIEGKWPLLRVMDIISSCALVGLVWACKAFPSFKGEYIFFAAVPLAVMMISSLYIKDKENYGKTAYLYTSILYIALPMSLTNFLVMDSQGNFSGWLLVAFYILIWASDIGAYLVGMSLGRIFTAKLFPSVSPKKSWAGFWGGLAAAIATSLVLYFTGCWNYVIGGGFTWLHAAILAAIMNITSVYGDLFESQWKRFAGVKDSGNAIPGHGGFLDRLDSTLFAALAGTIYLVIFNFINII